MTKSECLLCVGGPRDRQHVYLEPWEHVYPAAGVEAWAMDFGKPREPFVPEAALAIKTVVYERKWWWDAVFFNGLPTCILIPQGQTEDETRALLCNRV